jgi:hypothetical protein
MYRANGEHIHTKEAGHVELKSTGTQYYTEWSLQAWSLWGMAHTHPSSCQVIRSTSELALSEEEMAAFQAEAYLMSQLRHSNIVLFIGAARQ